jgi:hypothetical protein
MAKMQIRYQVRFKSVPPAVRYAPPGWIAELIDIMPMAKGRKNPKVLIKSGGFVSKCDAVDDLIRTLKIIINEISLEE